MKTEFIRYMISEFPKTLPRGIRYDKYKDAHDAAVRFSEREGKPYYVIEVTFVCDVITKVSEGKDIYY